MGTVNAREFGRALEKKEYCTRRGKREGGGEGGSFLVHIKWTEIRGP